MDALDYNQYLETISTRTLITLGDTLLPSPVLILLDQPTKRPLASTDSGAALHNREDSIMTTINQSLSRVGHQNSTSEVSAAKTSGNVLIEAILLITRK